MALFGISRTRFLLAVGAAALALEPSVALAQPGSQYKPVTPISLPLDRSGVWTMNFAYTAPRIITVTTPEGVRRQAWYMVYQVWNRSDTPQVIYPTFELVTKDGKLQTFLDEPQPYVAEAIRKVEDPTGARNLQTSISISKDKIPLTRPDSVPRAVYGVAVWMDAPQLAASSNNFSVYVTGLSNGLAAATNDQGAERIEQKTLQIDLRRPTDNARPEHDDFIPNDNGGLGAEKWVYRLTPRIGAAPAAKTPPTPDEKGK